MWFRKSHHNEQTIAPQTSDVLVIGGGMAGLYAALAAKSANPGLKVTMLVAGYQGAGGCSKKTHGINAAINPGDSWETHFADTMKGGGEINNPRLVEILCQQAPDRIRELESWGVKFDGDEIGYDVGTYGGSTHGRSIHWYDMTGLEIVQTLVRRVTVSGCYVQEHRWVVDLITQDNQCYGAVALNQLTGQVETYLAKATVLASGGGACVYPIATISADKLATGMMMAYDAGASLVDMEMVQFHPTGLVLPGSPGHGEIFEEEVRMKGGVLLNNKGVRFMPLYDPRAEKATRDIVARSSYIEILEGRGTQNNGVIFDISQLDKKWLQQRFPYMVERIRSWGTDLVTQDKIEISPTAHYLMGGVTVDTSCATDIKGLFACGEDAGGIDGGNRLGGNGVAGTLVFGNIAGKSASAYADRDMLLIPTAEPREIPYYLLNKEEYRELDDKIKRIMWNNVGLVRNGEDLSKAAWELEHMRGRLQRNKLRNLSPLSATYDSGLLHGKTLMNKLQLAMIITRSAMTRTNSVGAHYRTDGDNQTQMYNVFVKKNRDELPMVWQRSLSLVAEG